MCLQQISFYKSNGWNTMAGCLEVEHYFATKNFYTLWTHTDMSGWDCGTKVFFFKITSKSTMMAKPWSAANYDDWLQYSFVHFMNRDSHTFVQQLRNCYLLFKWVVISKEAWRKVSMEIKPAFCYWTFPLFDFQEKTLKNNSDGIQFSLIHLVFSGHRIFNIATKCMLSSKNVAKSSFMT